MAAAASSSAPALATLAQLEEVVQRGQWYYPATERYSDGIINCDGCEDVSIVACIGYEELDVCLECAKSVTRNLAAKARNLARKEAKSTATPMTRMEPRMVRPREQYQGLTRMEPRMVRPQDVTRMEPAMVRPQTKMKQQMFTAPRTRMRQNMYETTEANADVPSTGSWRKQATSGDNKTKQMED
jgi:hypothetical protein